MSDDKPNYPYTPLPRKEHPLTAEEQKKLDKFMCEWEAELIGDEPKPKAPL